LAPNSKARTPAGLVDEGGGFARVRIPVIKRHGKHVTAGRGTIDVFGSEHVLGVTASREVGVLRHNNRVIFYIAGPGLGHVANIKLKVFAKGPIVSSRLVRLPQSQMTWRKILDAKPTGLVSLRIDPSKLSCQRLTASRKELADALSFGLAPDLRYQVQVHRQLKASIDSYAAIRHFVNLILGLPRMSKSKLIDAYGKTALRIGLLKAEIANLDLLIGQVDALIKACAPPPPTTTPTTTTPLPPAVQAVQTAPGLSQQLTPQPSLALSPVQPQGVPIISVNDQLRYQQFSGVGANLTDSAAWLIYSELSPADHVALIQDLFGIPGLQTMLGVPPIHLNFLRVAMGASGAMTVGAPYSYDDMPAGQSDPSLAQFSIAHDLPYTIPTLQQALAINPGLQILASPWSPPGWMKSNGSLDNVNGQGTLLPSAYGPLANYFVKFIQAYAAQGIPVDAVTPQNEPRSGGSGTAYPGLTLPEANEAQFIAQNLQPAFSAAGLRTKIYGHDLSWDQLNYAGSLATGPAASDLSGIAWHCYFGSPTVMSQLHQSAPGLDQIADECSPEIRPFGAPEYLISTLRNWASVAAVWGVALDPNGGPIQPGNNCGGCRGLVTIDEQTHTVTFRTEYYQLGQVSAFVQPGAARIDSQNFVSYGVNSSNILTVTAGLDDVAFLNPDGSKVLVAYNNSAAPISFGVQSNGSYFSYTIPPQAMTTFLWH
jgi:glucosylceramidase